MTITFKCTDCEKQYRVRDEFTGKRLKCKSCGTAISVPSPESTDGEDEFQSALDEMARLESRSAVYAEYDSPGLPPKAGGSKRKRPKKSKLEHETKRAGTNTNSLAIIVGVLCLVHSGGAAYFDFRIFRYIFSMGFGFSSILLLVSSVASTALLIAGIGILAKQYWSVGLAQTAAISLLAVLGISVLRGLFYLLTSSSQFFGFNFFVNGILRGGAIPFIVVWWSLQDPEL